MADDVQIDEAFFVGLGQSDSVFGLCLAAANQVADVARGTAPVDRGDYRASITVREGQRPGRRVAIVEASDPAALIIESRTGTLARALRAVSRSR